MKQQFFQFCFMQVKRAKWWIFERRPLAICHFKQAAKNVTLGPTTPIEPATLRFRLS
jgi:hypothetical protein